MSTTDSEDKLQTEVGETYYHNDQIINDRGRVREREMDSESVGGVGGNEENCSSGSLQSGVSAPPLCESNISGGSEWAGSWPGDASTSTGNSSSDSTPNETAHNARAPRKPRLSQDSLEKASSASTDQRSKPDIPNVVEYHLKVKSESSIKTPEEEKTNFKSTSDSQTTVRMKKDDFSCSSITEEKKKELITALCRLTIDKNVFEGSQELPQVFQVKYLGSHDARGLWGIKHTRKPVDNMVAAAKALPTSSMLPLVKLIVSKEGVAFMGLEKKKQELNTAKVHAIETISYGVQDLIYTRVFCMIVVRESDHFRKVSPFECHAFVCESKQHARQLTYALATAFHLYSTTVKATQPKESASLGNAATNKNGTVGSNAKAGENTRTIHRYAIDLRSPEEIAADLALDSEA